MRTLLVSAMLATATLLLALPGASAGCDNPADVFCDDGFPNEICALYVQDPVFNGLCFPLPCIEPDVGYCDLD